MTSNKQRTLEGTEFKAPEETGFKTPEGTEHKIPARTDFQAPEGTMIIGLTGGIGTGKSTAAEYLVSKGMVHIDADAISRQITVKEPGVRNPVLEEIGQAFASEDLPPVLREDGSLDRQTMAGIVFHDPDKKKLLEEILFREIKAEIFRRIEDAGKDAQPAPEEGGREEEPPLQEAGQSEGRSVLILLDVPLLIESGLASLCDYVIVLTAEMDLRIRRVTERDGCSAEDVEARIRNQMPDKEKIARADFVADNSGTEQELYDRLDEIMSNIL